MDKLSRSKDPGRSAEAKRVEIQNWPAVTGQTGSTDRSDRSGYNSKIQTGQTGYSDRSLPDSPPTKVQMSNLE